MFKRTGMVLLWAGFLAAGVLLGGCRVHPISLGMMIVGDMVNDADIDKRAEILMNQPVAAADKMFGARLETLEDTTAKRELVLYPVEMDLLKSERYAVEVVNNRITAVSRMKHNIDGSEDVLEDLLLEDKVLGKGPKECEEAAEFMLAGACAVQVGTATFSDPNAAGSVRDGLIAYLERQHEAAARDIVGTLKMGYL